MAASHTKDATFLWLYDQLTMLLLFSRLGGNRQRTLFLGDGRDDTPPGFERKEEGGDLKSSKDREKARLGT